jgi:hypothetical protein
MLSMLLAERCHAILQALSFRHELAQLCANGQDPTSILRVGCKHVQEIFQLGLMVRS